MGKSKITKIQVANIVRKLQADPTIEWLTLARQYGVTKAGMHQRMIREMAKVDPDWVHMSKGRPVRTCDECGDEWQETRNYGGPKRRFCPNHRDMGLYSKRDGSGRFRSAS